MEKRIFFMPSLWGNFRVVAFAVPEGRILTDSLCVERYFKTDLFGMGERRGLWLSDGSANGTAGRRNGLA